MSGNSAFNVSEALSRLMNNKGLYTKLLTKFHNEYADFAQKVSTALDADNFDEAVHLAHTMKGLAGNLGAEGLNVASKDLESALKEGRRERDELGSLYERFKEELDRAIEEAKNGVDM